MSDVLGQIRGELDRFRENLREDYAATNDRVSKVDERQGERWERHLEKYNQAVGSNRNASRVASAVGSVALMVSAWALHQIFENARTITALTGQTQALADQMGVVKGKLHLADDEEPEWAKTLKMTVMKAVKEKPKAYVGRKDPGADANINRYSEFMSKRALHPGDLN